MPRQSSSVSYASFSVITQDEFIKAVMAIAKGHGCKLEINRDGLSQIDFGNKKLHENHLKALFPAILQANAKVSALIEKVAPGRPCTHKPMREIVEKINAGETFDC